LQLQFCIPTGVTVLLIMKNTQLGGFAVVKMLGAAALAQYTVGSFMQSVLSAVTNSVATVLLPEMVRRQRAEADQPLTLWQRGCVINFIILLPLIILLERYADTVVTAVFGQSYAPAVTAFQISLVLCLRNCVDFTAPLRAVKNTRPLVYCNLAAIVVNAIGLSVLLPPFGIAGAVMALVISSLVEPVYLSRVVMREYRLAPARVLPWRRLMKVGAAGLIPASLIAISPRVDPFGLWGVAAVSLFYCTVFVVLLRFMHVEESDWLAARISGSLQGLRARILSA
jgi:O-antigen/teichoic acid export membrane protein